MTTQRRRKYRHRRVFVIIPYSIKCFQLYYEKKKPISRWHFSRVLRFFLNLNSHTRHTRPLKFLSPANVSGNGKHGRIAAFTEFRIGTTLLFHNLFFRRFLRSSIFSNVYFQLAGVYRCPLIIEYSQFNFSYLFRKQNVFTSTNTSFYTSLFTFFKRKLIMETKSSYRTKLCYAII